MSLLWALVTNIWGNNIRKKNNFFLIVSQLATAALTKLDVIFWTLIRESFQDLKLSDTQILSEQTHI